MGSSPPWRCFDLGRASACVLSRIQWRAAVIAFSSWSHAILTPKQYPLYPDVDADRAMYETIRAGDYESGVGCLWPLYLRGGAQEPAAPAFRSRGRGGTAENGCSVKRVFIASMLVNRNETVGL